MNSETKNLVLRRYAAALNPVGRLWLLLHVQQQRMRALLLARGSDSLKRMLDMVVSLIALVLLGPLLGLIALAVWIEDGGSIFFAQTRVGKHGRLFKMYKIRSMCLDAERRLNEVMARNQHKEGVTFKVKDDPRITRVGK